MDPQALYKKYLESSLRFLAYRPRSEKEVRDNLTKKKAPSDVIKKIIIWLKEQKFLNDEEFVRWWIEQRSQFRQRGIRIIKLELKQKGIRQELIDIVVQGAEYKAPSDLESAKKIVEKKIAKYRGLDRREIYQKLGAHLARRGFDWETIKKSIDDVIPANLNDD